DAQRVQGVAENKTVAGAHEEERLDAEMIARAEETPLAFVADRKSEITEQMVDALFSPFQIGVQDQFVIIRLRIHAQLRAQFVACIDPRVGLQTNVPVN